MWRKAGTKTRHEERDFDVERRPTNRYAPDYHDGLTSAQAKEHCLDGWSNVTVDPPAQTTTEIIKSNVFTYFNLIFAILTVLLCIVFSFRNLTFLPVIMINTLIGIIQEIRAKKVLEKLTMLNAPKASVVRDGHIVEVDSVELVLDDIVIFKAGNQVCADAAVVEGEVHVNEALLTGESDVIVKKPGDHLMSGSFIVAGECYSRLEQVGADSYISKLTLEAKAINKKEQSEMIRALDWLVKLVGVAIIPIGIALFYESYVGNGDTFRVGITSMVAAVIGMIPEGLYLLTSVALAVSSVRLAHKKVLLHDMKSIETLARVNVLCVDKTGTITENTMSVKELIPTENYDAKTMPEIEKLVGDFVAAMSSDNITMETLKEYFKDITDRVAQGVTPFTSAWKYSGVTFEDGAYVLGAPEFTLRNDYENDKDDIKSYAKKGYRVLVFGSYDGELEGGALKGTVTPLAYILLANPVRKEAPDTFAYFAEQGVAVKVISGDNPLTVSEVAKEAKIANAENYVDATTLRTEEEIADAVSRYAVFGRVTPDQKRQFVKALKRQGKTVAMTGDGVNDVLALKDADCSVAMASGSDAAVQASQVVLLESDFARMPSVVLEGRRVVNNIQRSASLFLVKNIFSFLLAIFSVVFSFTYPLEPSQISLISMFTIGIPAFFLALQPNKERIEGHFLSNVLLKALPAGLTDALIVAALVIFGYVFTVDTKDIATASTMLLAIVGFMILFKICKPVNVLRAIVLIGCIAGLLVCSFFLPKLFALKEMSIQCVMLFGIFSIATEPMLRYLTMGVGRLENGVKKFADKRRARKFGEG